MCYAAIALVTDMDAGVEAGEGVGQEEVFALFAREHRAAQGRCSPASSATCPTPATAAPARPGPTASTCTYEIPGGREGPADRLGRVHRRGDRPRSSRPRGDEVVRVDLMLPRGARRRPSRRRAPTGSTCATPRRWADLLDGVDVVCHQAAMVGRGRHGRRPARRTPPTTTSAPRRCSPRCTRPGVDRLVLASSMVVYGEGRYACPEHGDQAPAAAQPRRRSTPGDFENHCPVCGRPLDWALVDEDARLDPRSSYAASKVAQEHYAAAWARQAGARGGRAALPQRLRPADAAGHAVLRGGRDVPLLARARRAAAGLRGRRPDARLRARRRRRPGQPRWRSTRWSSDARRPLRGVQRLLRATRSRSASRRAGRRGHRARPRARGHRRLPARRRPAHRRLARSGPRAELGFTRRGRARARACRAFATAPAAATLTLTSRCSSRCCTSSASDHLHRRAPAGASARAAARSDSSSHGTNGSQIRSTSALLICDGPRAAPSRRAGARRASSTTRVPVAPAAAAAGAAGPRPAPSERPGAERERGEVAPHPVRRGPAARDAVPVAVVEHRVGLPPARSRTARTPAPPPAPRRTAARQRPPAPGRRPAPPARAARAAAGRRTASRA